MPNNYNPYANNYLQEMQSMRDRIDRQMQAYQQSQNQYAQQPQIQQTFQLSNPVNSNDFDTKYAESTDEVKNTLVFKNSLFINKEMSKLWVKDTRGNMKSFELTEVIEKDEKDLELDELKKQIEQLTLIIQKQNKEKESNTLAKVEPVKKVVEKKSK